MTSFRAGVCLGVVARRWTGGRGRAATAAGLLNLGGQGGPVLPSEVRDELVVVADDHLRVGVPQSLGDPTWARIASCDGRQDDRSVRLPNRCRSRYQRTTSSISTRSKTVIFATKRRQWRDDTYMPKLTLSVDNGLSRIRYCGASSRLHASSSCRTVHSAVGCR
jgi:hypothetical protein